MKKIAEILQSNDGQEVYRLLTSKKKPFVKTLEETEKEFDPYRHNVMDRTKRKRKKVKVPTGRTDPHTGEKLYKEKYIERCRVAVPFQRILTERPVGFLFSIPVEYKMQNEVNDERQRLFDIVMRVLHKNKIKYLDKKLARAVFRQRECAELWYYELDASGKPSTMRVKLLTPLDGDRMYPHFDDYDHMDGFAREYVVKDEENILTRHFDVYTDEYVYNYINGGSGYELVSTRRHGFKKIPIVYYRQEETEWNIVQPVIERVEELLSNWGDTNDYFGMPSYFTKGRLKGFAEKGETGRVYQGDGEGADMKVLSWDSSPTSVTGELANLINIIFSYTQTPDISFENMKTLGNNTSGTAIKLMFTDPHMKVGVKIELFGECFTRRYNIVQNGVVTTGVPGEKAIPERVADEIDVEPQFTPYFPKNEYEEIQMIQAAVQKPTMSQEEGVRQNPRINNPKEVLEQLQQESQAAMVMDAFGAAQ